MKRAGRLQKGRPLEAPARPNQRWLLNFVSSAFTDGGASGCRRSSTISPEMTGAGRGHLPLGAPRRQEVGRDDRRP